MELRDVFLANDSATLSDLSDAAQNNESFALDFACWTPPPLSVSAAPNREFAHTDIWALLKATDKVRVIGYNEFPYTRGRPKHEWELEREIWLDLGALGSATAGPHNLGILHVHYAAPWSDDRFKRDRSVIKQVNVRHTTESPQKDPRFKSQQLDKWREDHGRRMAKLPEGGWHWRDAAGENEHEKLQLLRKLLQKAEATTKWVRALTLGAAQHVRKETSQAQPRSALIVAVSEYECDNVADLANTIIDATRLQAVLLQLGWSVEMAVGLGLEETESRIEAFAKSRATGEDDCLLAFVGHGIEINGRNYLVTKDSMLKSEYDSEAKFEKDVQRKCLAFADVQAWFKDARGSASGVTLFVLDCCRSGFETSVGAGRSVAARFMSRAAESSQIRPDFPNSHIIYSTTSGSVASDGERGKGGPFMSIFTEEIKPDQEVRKVTQATRKRLRESAPDLCQLAPETSLLERDFYFGLGPTRQDRAGESAAAASVAAAAAAPSSPAAGADEALQALLREHGVEDALPWLVREGVTRCEHLRDVTEQELHDSGLGKFAVRRFSSLLTALQISAPAEETSEKTEQLRAEALEEQLRAEALEYTNVVDKINRV